jgi:glucose-6-phosphate isomerase
LPLAIAIGAAQFGQFLGGAHEMDVHYRSAGFSNNLPILLAVRTPSLAQPRSHARSPA